MSSADLELRWGGHGIAGPIEPWRIDNLLRTRRTGPSNERDWSARVRALAGARRHAAPELADRITAEVHAMYAERDAWQERRRARLSEHVEADTAAMNDCPMRDPSVRGMDPRATAALRLCWLDGKPLPERRQRWCSDGCVRLWGENHEWSMASGATRKRDGERCVRCDRLREPVSDVCAEDGEPWPCQAQRDALAAGLRWVPRPGQDYTTGHQRETTWLILEVNHREPRRGRGYHQGCFNHQDLLETLCKPCHQAETNRQRA